MRAKYLGGGFLRGVPARDLTAAEVATHGKEKLLNSGLYAIIEKSKQKNPPTHNKRASGASENK